MEYQSQLRFYLVHIRIVPNKMFAVLHLNHVNAFEKAHATGDMNEKWRNKSLRQNDFAVSKNCFLRVLRDVERDNGAA